MPLGPLEALLVFAIVTLGAAVQSTAGFGLAMIAAPALLLIYGPLVPGPLMAASLVAVALIARRDRAHIDFAGLRFALAGRLLGTLAAAGFLALATPFLFDLVFASLVLAGVALSAAGVHVHPGRASAAFAGSLSGLMGTISSVGGPPMALLYQRAGAARLRGTLSGYFLAGTTMSLAALAVVGRYGGAEVLLSLFLIPGMIVGFLAGSPVSRILPDRAIRPLVLVLSGLSALIILWRAFARWAH